MLPEDVDEWRERSVTIAWGVVRATPWERRLIRAEKRAKRKDLDDRALRLFVEQYPDHPALDAVPLWRMVLEVVLPATCAIVVGVLFVLLFR